MARQSDSGKLVNAFAKVWNPLRNMTQSSITSMVEQIKHGNDVRMQVAFSEMERTTPIFGICINKRIAGITDRQWDITPLDDSAEAKAQAEAIKEMFKKSDFRNLDGLTEALRHLGMAAFRGRSCVKPFIDKDGELYFKNIPNTNTLEWNDKLYFNLEADQSYNFLDENSKIDLPQLTEDEVCWIKEERPVDIPGLQVYLRQLVGETQWARFVEKEGVPQVVITAPDATPENVLDQWTSRAINIFEGGSGVLPSGAQVEQLTQGRGQDPFSAFIEHQMEMIVLLACGEKLTTLGGATGLGSELAEIQSKEFQNLINYDCKRIQNTITRCAVRKCAKHLGYKECKCRFEFTESDNTPPEKYLEMAKVLHELGVSIDVNELKNATKLAFIDEKSWSPQIPGTGWTRKDAEEEAQSK